MELKGDAWTLIVWVCLVCSSPNTYEYIHTWHIPGTSNQGGSLDALELSREGSGEKYTSPPYLCCGKSRTWSPAAVAVNRNIPTQKGCPSETTARYVANSLRITVVHALIVPCIVVYMTTAPSSWNPASKYEQKSSWCLMD